MMADSVPNEPGSQPPPDPATDRVTTVGMRLRQIFDDVAAEPLPEAFRDLLRKLG